ncbi:hypothetical protein NDN08_004064 [Rhodosorus marinus]|uniref:2-methoxy-6-polyprenyl-1,4-benzoquinol methylase, mitochondrial n=1 Tax=Rhodosorus marinus TaxID=101924 RepID=A0AAV8UH72_9RHOD|nr:hypothetical protein NDN08_004064 [Rhodosorus marinus]
MKETKKGCGFAVVLAAGVILVVCAAESHGSDHLVRDGSGEFFDAIASTYDLLNSIISLGLDHTWRRTAIKSLELDVSRLLDVATGTADVAILAAEMNDHVNVVGIDPSQKMLDIGKEKVLKKQMTERVQLLIGKAENLSQFKEESFDHEIVSFGVRNFQDREAGLKEMARVLKKNGRVAILELTGTDENEKGLLSTIRELFISTIMPIIGGLISGHRETYR